VTIFLGCSLLVTCLEWVGNGSKISCVMEGAVDSWTIPQNVINTYCYVLTTFTLPKHWNSKIGYESAHKGVGAFNPLEDEVTFKAYYQWVPFVLFLQVSTQSPKFLLISIAILICYIIGMFVLLSTFAVQSMGRRQSSKHHCWT
jgi:hypothetical protein